MKLDKTLLDDLLLEAGGAVQGLSIPVGQWHTVNVLEPTVILECKDGKYEPDRGGGYDKSLRHPFIPDLISMWSQFPKVG